MGKTGTTYLEKKSQREEFRHSLYVLNSIWQNLLPLFSYELLNWSRIGAPIVVSPTKPTSQASYARLKILQDWIEHP